MKAQVIAKFGSPDVNVLHSVPSPESKHSRRLSWWGMQRRDSRSYAYERSRKNNIGYYAENTIVETLNVVDLDRETALLDLERDQLAATLESYTTAWTLSVSESRVKDR